MIDIVDSVNQELKNHQDIEESSFYKNYQVFSKEYDKLIQNGLTHRRESQLRGTLDYVETTQFSYNNISPNSPFYIL
jgi:hypothetical protein